MEFKEFYQKYMRMCKSYENCEGCPRHGKSCLEFGLDLDGIEELESDVERWNKKHSRKTRLQDFLEKYPNAQLRDDGLPYSCCEALGYGECCKQTSDPCFDCWNMPVGEDK